MEIKKGKKWDGVIFESKNDAGKRERNTEKEKGRKEKRKEDEESETMERRKERERRIEKVRVWKEKE